jgi:hypothetical protein
VKQRRFHPLLALAVVAALLLGACSSGGDDDDAKDTTTTTEAEGNGGDGGDETTTTEDGGDETTTTEGGESGDPVDVGGDGEAYVDAMVQSMKAEDDFPLSDDQAECFSSRFVDTIGVDRLQEHGITPEMMASDDESMEFTELELSEDEGNELYDHFGDCGIDLREMMLQSMAAEEDTTPEMQACMEGVFTDENLRTFMVAAMTGGDDAMENDPEAAAVMSGLMGCAFMGMDTGDIETGDLGEG